MLTDSAAVLEVPDWLLDGPPAWEVSDDPLVCACCGSTHEVAAEEPVRWAIPGVSWDTEPTPAAQPDPGPAVRRLVEAVAALATVEPVALPGAVALAEAEAVQRAVRDLRVLLLPRVADVKARSLYELVGLHSLRGWQQQVAPDAVATDRALSERLAGLPELARALADDRRVSLDGAKLVAAALRKVGPYLDRPDGLIDALPGDEVVAAVLENTIELVCRAKGGLAEDDPVLTRLQTQVMAAVEAGGSQDAQVEAAFVLLATHLPRTRDLKAALEEQVFAVVPNLLEQQQQRAEERRGLALRRNPDGSWEVEATLTPECGERLFTALGAEARRDPANPIDTLAREHARTKALLEQGKNPFTDQPALPDWESTALIEALTAPAGTLDEELLVPRNRSRRVHDALDRLLNRYLSAGLGGIHDKVPVQATVTIPAARLEGAPGALPGRTGSGRPVAQSLLRRWWGNAHVTTLLLSKGWVPLGEAHSGRTLAATERKALLTRWNNRCAGADCCPGDPDPLIPLVPHHVLRHSLTGHSTLEESLPVCDRLHHDLHTGKRTVLLRDGRLVTEDGYLQESE